MSSASAMLVRADDIPNILCLKLKLRLLRTCSLEVSGFYLRKIVHVQTYLLDYNVFTPNTIRYTNRNQGKLVLERALKTHCFQSTYVGIVQNISRCLHIDYPTYLQNHSNRGTIMLPIRMQTMASMLVIPWFQLRGHITDTSFRLDPAVFR